MSHRQIHIHFEPGLWPLSWPMGLTMLRLLLLPVFLFVLLNDANHEVHHWRWLAVAIFGVMAITDKLDGYLARKFHQTSKVGMLLDPIADKLLIACTIILLSFSWVAPHGFVIPKYVVAVVYGKDLIVAIGSLILLSIAGKVTVTPRPLGKLSTFLQLSLLIATLISPDIARLSERLAWWLTRILWLAVVTITAASCIDYIVQGVAQLGESRKTPVT